MRVKIGNEIYDTVNEPIMLIFENDSERKTVANNLISMDDKDAIRKYVTYPDDYTIDEIYNFMKI